MCLLDGNSCDGLYHLNSKNCLHNDNHVAAIANNSDDFHKWHRRCEHPSSVILSKIAKHFNLSFRDDNKCLDCPLSKLKKLPFNPRKWYNKQPLETLHMDVWGPAPIPSINNHKYYLLIVDEYSRFSWLFPLELKSKVFQTFRDFHIMIEKSLGLPIRSIQTDCGGEFLNLKFQNYCREFGIRQKFSSPCTLEQNGLVERKHGHLISITRCFFLNLTFQRNIG